jgi:5-methylcytosine-specific restriction endonuclease McrA
MALFLYGETMAKEYARAFYASGAWRSLRKQILHRDLYTCADCDGRAEEVHHKTELTPDNINDPNITLNPDNLISLCHDCHTKRRAGCGDIADGYYFDEKGQVVRG